MKTIDGLLLMSISMERRKDDRKGIYSERQDLFYGRYPDPWSIEETDQGT